MVEEGKCVCRHWSGIGMPYWTEDLQSASMGSAGRPWASMAASMDVRDYLTIWVKGCCCAKEWKKGGKK